MMNEIFCAKEKGFLQKMSSSTMMTNERQPFGRLLKAIGF
jgi:hypothetical protein